MQWMRRIGGALAAAALVVAGLAAVRSLVVVSVAGGSMEPALLPADIAVVRRTREATRGDIALLASPTGSRFLHRVVRRTPSGAVQTRGDANPSPDLEPTPAARVLGRVVLVVPAGTLIARWRESAVYATLTAQQNTARQ